MSAYLDQTAAKEENSSDKLPEAGDDFSPNSIGLQPVPSQKMPNPFLVGEAQHGTAVLRNNSAANIENASSGMPENDIKYSVLIMARNEADNLRLLLPWLHEVLGDQRAPYEIIIVDGHSRDETVALAKEHGAIVYSQNGPGYGAAFKEGLSYCRGQWIITVDADHSPPPQSLRSLIANRHGTDLVIASRYVPGAAAHMEFYRYWLSRILSNVFRMFLAIPVRDLSSGFRMYRRAALDGVELVGRDFDVLIEILVRVLAKGRRVREVPFIYEPRIFGRSNARLLHFAVSYLLTLKRMWDLKNSVASADYDERAFNSIIPLQRYWQRQRVKHVLALSDQTVQTADIGCGSSRISRSFPRLIGIDINVNPLRFLSNCGVVVVGGDLFNLPVRSQSFDQVILSSVIQHLPKEKFSLEEVCRILKPGGVLIVGTPDYSSRLWRIIEPIYRFILPYSYGSFSSAHYTSDQLTDVLARWGFRVVAKRTIAGCEMILKCELIRE